MIGGLLVDHASYHWIFWLGAVPAVLAAVLAHVLIPESPVRTPGKVDLRGAAVLAVGLVAPLIAITQASDWGWLDARTLGLFAFGLARPGRLGRAASCAPPSRWPTSGCWPSAPC